MARDLTRIGERARKDPKARFTSIYHFVMDLDLLRDCFRQMGKGKAPGVDGVTKEEYGRDLEGNLRRLLQRLAQMSYRPQPVLRRYIPKPGRKKMRPLGLPCFEDKLVQKALSRVLEQIYEADFLGLSYGYRPKRTQHQALARLGRTIQQRKVSWVAEADVRSFFDRLDQEWLMKFLSVRIGDRRVLRLIARILRSGVMEDGLELASDRGTPQGGSLSALLSNVYLHYALDLWFEKRFRASCQGEAHLFRFADDFVGCFQYQADAQAYLRELEGRLAKFSLEVEPSKTKLVSFGRFAPERARRSGRKPETFDFLGFTHYCGETRHGRFKVKRRTSRKKFRAKLGECKAWLRINRSRVKGGALLRRAKLMLDGHLQYYAVTDNGPMCNNYRHQFGKLLFKWMNRRSQRRSYTWEQFNQALAWVGWPSVRIRHNICPFAGVGPE
ncbi:MAG TPA: group II intron reverse transcriptase/maturase [Acidobacteriota bacterium]|nr:group II intron reverse transcriptase/maturase [Acidobacteriota bacterium]